MEGSYGTGGTCTESYEVETNLPSCTVNVCIYDYKIGVGEDDERETSNVVSFEFENNLNYQFIFDGDYEKSFVEDIFENMMKYSL